MDIEHKIEEVCEMQKCLMAGVKAEFASGLANVNTKEAGEAIDMIKDLSEAEKNYRESCYYEKVTKAMEEAGDQYGYTPRMSGNIRYGFKPMVDQEPYMADYIRNPKEFTSKMGEEYDRFKEAKKWYTDTKSASYKTEMDEHTKKHLDNAIATLKEMWADANPELRVHMKTDLTSLVNTMTV